MKMVKSDFSIGRMLKWSSALVLSVAAAFAVTKPIYALINRSKEGSTRFVRGVEDKSQENTGESYLEIIKERVLRFYRERDNGNENKRVAESNGLEVSVNGVKDVAVAKPKVLEVKVGVDSDVGVVEGGVFSYLNDYDWIINQTVEEYNKRLGINLDSDLVKAIISSESGDPKDRKGAFVYDPMQIANKGDFALDVLVNRKESTYLIGNFSFLEGKKKTVWNRKKKCWDYSNSNMDAKSSIRGGVGWLVHKAAIYDERIIEEGPLQEYVVRKRDNFSKIAWKENTTVETLRKYNPSVNLKKLIPGKTRLKFRKARREIYIRGWRPWRDAVKRYNGGGNPDYVREVYDVLRELKNP